MRRVLIVVMPLADPKLPNLGVEQLAAIARSAGEACDILYGTLLLSPSILPAMISSIGAPAIFTPTYYNQDPEQTAMALTRDFLHNFSNEKFSEDFVEAITMDYLIGMDAADMCIERCCAAIPTNRYDVVSFSVSIDTQKLPSASLARRLKAREPELRVLFGGTACDGPMGHALLELFPEVDAILQGEADLTFLQALEALRGGCTLISVPNFLYRETGEICESPEDSPIHALDNIPLPDYHSFLQQRQASFYQHHDLILLFETSRGCKWGQKQRCAFCGIKTIDAGYRIRSPQSALELIETLKLDYSPKILYATDVILEKGYLHTLLPELARRRHIQDTGINLFYEVRTDLSRSDIALMAAAGVHWVQPGIESFNSHMLHLIHKGARGLQQVEFLKWAETYGINPIYSLMTGIPGESIADYEQMLALIPTLHHLPPPLLVNRMILHRFSPYASNPVAYGITGIQPFEAQRITYQSASDELLLRLCYELDCTIGGQNEPLQQKVQKNLAIAVANWRAAYQKQARLTMKTVADKVFIIRRSPDGNLRIWLLDGLKAQIYSLCEHIRTLDWIAQRSGASSEVVVEIIHNLAADGLVAVHDYDCLALAVPVTADAWQDSGLTDKNVDNVLSAPCGLVGVNLC